MSRRRVRLQISLLIVSLGLAAACGSPDSDAPQTAPPTEVYVTEVSVSDVPIVREWVGETRGRADIEIRARIRGFLEGIHFREGGRVKKGQLLYSIDPSELMQEVTAANASLAAAKTELAYAETDVARYRPLAEINAVSQRDLDSTVARFEASEAQVEAAEAILRLSEINLSYSKIKSPMDGMIGLSMAKVGDYVGQNPNPVVLNTVSDTDPIHVRFPVGEREYLQLARSYPSTERDNDPESLDTRTGLELILADGTVHPERGYAKFIERNIDASTGTLMIEAAFPNPELLLRPGQYGRIRAVVGVEKGARLIPQRCVQELQGQYQVWVVTDGGTADLRNVQMGRRVDQMWIVEGGLEPGEQVVVEGIQRLRAGAPIDVQPWVAPEPPAQATVAGS